MPIRIPWPRRVTPAHEDAVRRGWQLLEAGNAEQALDAFDHGGPHPEAPLGKARALLELGDGVGAHRSAREISLDRLPMTRQQEARRIRAAALLEVGRREAALGAIEEALRLEPEDWSARRQLAHVLFCLGRLEEGEREAAQAAQESQSDAAAWSLLGRIQVFRGASGDDAFARAARLEPEHYPRPHRVSRTQFEQLAGAALDEIPETFQRYLANTLIVVEDHPSLEAVRHGTDPDLLGIYEGGTALESGMPEHIVLYQKNHENLCPTAADLRAEVRATILHEVGHHFGMEETEMPF